jgi:hypothetical protein
VNNKYTIEIPIEELSLRSGISAKSIPKFLGHLVEDGLILDFVVDRKNKSIFISALNSLELLMNSDLFKVDDSETS